LNFTSKAKAGHVSMTGSVFGFSTPRSSRTLPMVWYPRLLDATPAQPPQSACDRSDSPQQGLRHQASTKKSKLKATDKSDSTCPWQKEKANLISQTGLY
jgi:hypothetical protein